MVAAEEGAMGLNGRSQAISGGSWLKQKENYFDLFL